MKTILVVLREPVTRKVIGACFDNPSPGVVISTFQFHASFHELDQLFPRAFLE